MSEFLDAIEIETAPRPATSVIWLHGLGADGNDFVPIVGELDLPDVPIRFVFPHAPMQPVTINNGMVMRAWYDIAGGDAARREDERGVRASQGLVEALIAREQARGTPAHRLLLAGFSQGGAIALQTGLRHPERLAGEPDGHGGAGVEAELAALVRDPRLDPLAGREVQDHLEHRPHVHDALDHRLRAPCVRLEQQLDVVRPHERVA